MDTIKQRIAALKAGDGYVTVSYRGDVSLNYATETGSCWVSGIGHQEGLEIVAAAIAAGVMVADHSTARDYGELSKVVISGPMLAAGGHYDWGSKGPSAPREDGSWGSFAYAPREVWVAMRREIGCTIHNS